MSCINEHVIVNADIPASITASSIRDFLEFREGLIFESDIYKDVTAIIHFICTTD